MTRRDPYTLAREIESRLESLTAAVYYGYPLHEIAEHLTSMADDIRELRRAMVRRVAPLNRTEDTDNA